MDEGHFITDLVPCKKKFQWYWEVAKEPRISMITTLDRLKQVQTTRKLIIIRLKMHWHYAILFENEPI